MAGKLAILYLIVALSVSIAMANEARQEPAAWNTDVSPDIGPVAPVEPDRYWPILLTVQSQQLTGSQLQLGVAFGGPYFWVTSGGQSSASTTDNQLFRFSSTGAFIDSLPQPNVNSGWGWRDLAFDGTYLYAGCEYSQIQAFDPNTGALVPSMNVTKPTSVAVARALAYDPVTDHFWTGNFANNIVEFDRSGNIIWQGSPAPLTAIYGMAWDALGHWLWIYDQGSPGAVFHQYNPFTHAYTGVTDTIATGIGIAGGCEMTHTWNPNLWVMVAMIQGTPYDYFVVAQVYYTPATSFDVTLTPINPPIVIPANGGNFDFNASVVRQLPPQAPFVVWARIKNPDGSYTSPTLGPVTINPPLGGWVTRMRTQTVPSTWAAGIYTYLGYANNTFAYPAIDSSFFTFTKSATVDGCSWITEASCTGEPFPGEEAISSQPSAISLQTCRPNPFNASTVASFELRVASHVSLKVYDTAGRLVATLVDSWQPAGTHCATFNGEGLASGIYLARLEAGEFNAVQKLVLVK